MDRFKQVYAAALRDNAAGIFVGAGMSMRASYPSWRDLLTDIAQELEVDIDSVADLTALAQWSISKSSSRHRISSVILDKVAVEYAIPDPVLSLARLPIRHIWTTNYDTLIERAHRQYGRPIDVLHRANLLTKRPTPGAAQLYKMHGTVEEVDEVVISTDDYDLFRANRGGYIPLLQAHLTSETFLFSGLSFTDPNLRNTLGALRETFRDSPPEHYAIVRRPQPYDYADSDIFDARRRQHEYWSDDLSRYGLHVVEIDDYSELDDILYDIERLVRVNRVWISGSWPDQLAAVTREMQLAHSVAEGVGRGVAALGLTLVSGAGLVVGSAALSGFVSALPRSDSWDLTRRLITRPFPQPLPGGAPDLAAWRAIREDLARLAGVVVFVGGHKYVDSELVPAEGVLAEFAEAKRSGLFLLPIGATGGAAEIISNELIGSSVPQSGPAPLRPNDKVLRSLQDKTSTASQLVALAVNTIKSVSA